MDEKTRESVRRIIDLLTPHSPAHIEKLATDQLSEKDFDIYRAIEEAQILLMPARKPAPLMLESDPNLIGDLMPDS